MASVGGANGPTHAAMQPLCCLVQCVMYSGVSMLLPWVSGSFRKRELGLMLPVSKRNSLCLLRSDRAHLSLPRAQAACRKSCTEMGFLYGWEVRDSLKGRHGFQRGLNWTLAGEGAGDSVKGLAEW